ncbi:MAG: rhodanese-like domain-containing protein [Bacteroidota bacterium]|jgi:rhodanese-related sulfurtransferase
MKKSVRNSIIAAIAVAAIGYIAAQQTVQSPAAISVQETLEALQKDSSIVLLDVRTPQEHLGERIKNSPLIPVQELENRTDELLRYKNQKIIVYCRSGHRSGIATEILTKRGFHAVSMEGGILRWKSEQYPTITGPIQ